MKRPLCMVCLSFVIALFLFQWLFPIPFYKDVERDGEVVERIGQVYKKEYKEDTLLIYLQCGTEQILCYVREGNAPRLGSFIQVRGTYQSFQAATNPGQFHQKRYYQILNLNYSLKNTIMLKESIEYNTWKESLYCLKRKLAEGYEQALPQKEAGILKAMVLGDKSELDTDIKNLYKQSGISHVLAISGLHISLIGMGLYRLLKRMGIPILLNTAICMAAMIFYGMLIEGGTSSFRAIFMFLIYLIGKIIGRTYDMLTALAMSGVLLLIEQPLYIYHTGFLLSYCAVMGIGLLAPMLEQLLPEDKRKNPIIQNLLGSMSVALFSLPVTAYYFYEFPVYSLLLNLLIIPLMSLLLPCAMAGGAVAAWQPMIGKLLLIPCQWILKLYEGICEISTALPCHTMIIGKPALWRILFFYGMIILILCFYSKWKKRTIGLLLGLAVVVLCLQAPHNTEITMLDVGQGDGIFIQEKGGTTFLMDGGSSDVSGVGTYRIVPFLKSKGIRQITYAFVTHPDSDHYNGILECLEQSKENGIHIRYLAVSHLALKGGEEAYEKLFQAAREAGTEVVCISAGDVLKCNKLALTCLYPGRESSPADKNGESLMFLLEAEGVRMLFTGDAGMEEEAVILHAIPKVHILKTGHHGSNSSTGTGLLQAAAPEYAIISCGRNNSYGHPGGQTLERLAEANSRVLVTAQTGAIKITIRNSSYRIDTFLSE
ncbi:MAG: DNA internalization-related competence protein ComEC/Rec2 [Roseburia sp.]|nr:DNA internalization-related competence protein ComEC/Rec2 [Roseburia sp.]MCM1279019.1 DNA internalization-related competence protein ComEC/Rec2 [Robinsoniella sp.]